MSTTHSIDTDSTSSSNTMPTRSWNEQQIDPSNILYNDHQNYQIIFTNDSRFFDTSLHLFKSYRDLGYIPLDNKKSKKSLFSTSTNPPPKSQSNGTNRRTKSKRTGFSSYPNIDGNNNGTSQSPSSKSNEGSSKLIPPKIKREKSPVVISQQRQWTLSNYSNTNDDSSDDPDIIVTRL